MSNLVVHAGALAMALFKESGAGTSKERTIKEIADLIIKAAPPEIDVSFARGRLTICVDEQYLAVASSIVEKHAAGCRESLPLQRSAACGNHNMFGAQIEENALEVLFHPEKHTVTPTSHEVVAKIMKQRGTRFAHA